MHILNAKERNWKYTSKYTYFSTNFLHKLQKPLYLYLITISKNMGSKDYFFKLLNDPMWKNKVFYFTCAFINKYGFFFSRIFIQALNRKYRTPKKFPSLDKNFFLNIKWPDGGKISAQFKILNTFLFPLQNTEKHVTRS